MKRRVKNSLWAVVCVMGVCGAAWAQQKLGPQDAPKVQPAVAAAPEPVSSEPTASPQGLSALAQGVPRLVKFSGVIKDPLGKPRSGLVGITFAIYKDPEGGAALWLETQNVELDEQGHYTVLLGATKSEGLPLELFTANESRWLGAQVQLPGEVEQPRVLLVSVPYALKAAEAETLAGQPLSSFVLNTSQGSTTLTAQKGRASTAVGPAAAGTGTTDFVARWLDNLGTLGNSSIFDNGLVGIGTTNPQASLDVQLTTGAATNALNSTITLNNSSPITGSVLSAFKMTLLDASKASNLSKQPARFVYLRDASATGGVTAFDSVMTATSFLNANAPYQLRGVNIEGPTMATGTTLANFTGLYIGSPGGAGTVSNKFALLTEPNAGNVGIGTTRPSSILHAQNGASTLTSDIFSVDALAGECNSNGCTGVDAITSAPGGFGVFAEAPGSGAIAVDALASVGTAVLAVTSTGNAVNAVVNGACTSTTLTCNVFVGRGNLGNNVVRIDNTGRGFFDNGTQTGGADFAESFAVAGDRASYEPGDLLVIDRAGYRRLALAHDPYSTMVAGIYSTKPGVLATPYSIEDARVSQEIPLAVVGVVPCKATAENGPITVGDLLVASSTPGYAMRGSDRKRMLGAVVGKALEPLNSGKGVIEVLVTLQ